MNELYDEITQVELNTLIYQMSDFIKLEVPLNLLNNLDNKYCDLIVTLSDIELQGAFIEGVVSGDEIIVDTGITVRLINPVFNSLKYFLRVGYYELNPDINDNAENPLLYADFQLDANEDNIIGFSKKPVYLLSDITLIIKKGE